MDPFIPPAPLDLGLLQASALAPSKRPVLFDPLAYTVDLAHSQEKPLVQRPFLVEDIVPVRGPALMVGRSGIGKTPLLFQLGLSVAMGIPFVGLQTIQGRVLYIDAETSEEACYTYLRDLSTFLGVKPGENPPFHVHSVNWSPWPTPGEHHTTRTKRLIEALKPDLVIFDCLRPLWPQAETSSEAAQEFWAFQRELINTYGLATLTVHHIRKPQQDKQTGRTLGVRIQDPGGAREWLNNAAGTGALVTQAESRIAIDFWHSSEEDRLVIGGFTKARESMTPLQVERVYNDDHEPRGYRWNPEAIWEGVSEDDKIAYAALPNTFRYRDAERLFVPERSRSSVARLLDRLKQAGRLVQGKDKTYTKTGSQEDNRHG
jgi:hypothetical protein